MRNYLLQFVGNIGQYRIHGAMSRRNFAAGVKIGKGTREIVRYLNPGFIAQFGVRGEFALEVALRVLSSSSQESASTLHRPCSPLTTHGICSAWC